MSGNSGDGYVTYVGSSSDYNPNSPSASLDRLVGCSRVETVSSLREALGLEGTPRIVVKSPVGIF